MNMNIKFYELTARLPAKDRAPCAPFPIKATVAPAPKRAAPALALSRLRARL